MRQVDQLNSWMDQYQRAWASNDHADVGALFTEDAAYFTEPYATPFRGRRAIVDAWLERRDEPGQYEFTWQPLVITDDVAIIQGQTVYRQPRAKTYSNLWVIRLNPAGRCTEFTEWWMLRPNPTGNP